MALSRLIWQVLAQLEQVLSQLEQVLAKLEQVLAQLAIHHWLLVSRILLYYRDLSLNS